MPRKFAYLDSWALRDWICFAVHDLSGATSPSRLPTFLDLYASGVSEIC